MSALRPPPDCRYQPKHPVFPPGHAPGLHAAPWRKPPWESRPSPVARLEQNSAHLARAQHCHSFSGRSKPIALCLRVFCARMYSFTRQRRGHGSCRGGSEPARSVVKGTRPDRAGLGWFRKLVFGHYRDERGRPSSISMAWRASSAMWCPMGRDAVAAGEGTFHTCSIRSACTN